MSAYTKSPFAPFVALSALLTLAACTQPAPDPEVVEPAADAKIPVTSTSEQARQLYLEGRDLNEKLRAADARPLFQQAVEIDPGFALGHLGLANSATSAQEFFDALGAAVDAAGNASEAEQAMILGLEAGAKGFPTEQRKYYEKLVKHFPGDERAQNLLAGYYFGRQEWDKAVPHYERAIEINPDFSQPYNNLGYAQRFLGNFEEAEVAFRKYIELLPSEPNPHDSYAELLMKTGRFEESIAEYEAALALDPDFVFSFVGIGNNQLFMGKPAEARETFAKLTEVAANDGQRRQAEFWTAAAWLHQGKTKEALGAIGRMAAIAETNGDLAQVAGDNNLKGGILLEAGRPDEAWKHFETAATTMAEADVPQEVKDATQRGLDYQRSRVALAKGDIEAAIAAADAFAAAIEGRDEVPNEQWQLRELRGRIALARDDAATAVAELSQGNQQDPRILFYLAQAAVAAGDSELALASSEKAANFNGLAFNYAYVREDARKLVSELS